MSISRTEALIGLFGFVVGANAVSELHTTYEKISALTHLPGAHNAEIAALNEHIPFELGLVAVSLAALGAVVSVGYYSKR